MFWSLICIKDLHQKLKRLTAHVYHES